MELILVCTEKLPVPCIRGGAIQTYIDGILPHLCKAGRVTVFSVADPALPATEERDGVHHERIAATGADAYYREVAQRLAGHQPDWVVVYNRPKYLPALAAAVPNARFLLSMHNEMFLKGKISAEVARACLARTARVVTVSRFIADGIARLYPKYRHKLQPVYSGVDLVRFPPRWAPGAAERRADLRARHRLTDCQVLLNVSRLSEKKGAHVLLPALARTIRRHPKAVLLVVGSRWYGANEPDDYAERLYEQAEALGDAVRFTGFITPDQIPDYYLLGDIFVCASQWQEPLARVHYEAMAAGLPIVTTNRGGNAEVIQPGHNGLIVKRYRDPAAFAQRFDHLLSHPELAEQIGRNGRQLAEEKYGWARVAAEILRILEGS